MKTRLMKKGIGGLDKVVLSLVVLGFLLVIGMTLMGRVRDTTTAGTPERNASDMTISAIEQVPGWLPMIILALIAVVILGIIYMLKKRG